MSEKETAQALRRQFDHTLYLFDETINLFPDHLWYSGESESVVPARLAYHIMESIDFYTDDDPAGYDWNSDGLDWEGSQRKEMPDIDRLKNIYEEQKKKLYKWLLELETGNNIFQDSRHGHLNSILEQGIYLLKHTQCHIANMRDTLRRNGIEPKENCW